MVPSTLKIFALGLSFFFATACASNTAPLKPIEPPSKLQRLSSSKALRLGVIVQIPGAGQAKTKEIAESLQDQLELFDPCRSASEKEVWNAEVRWTSATNGLFSEVQIDSMVPKEDELKDCILQKLAEVDVGTQRAIWNGRLILGSYYGEIPPWRFKGPKILE